MVFRIFLFFCLLSGIVGWPDGAPCIHAAYESMNPLEAVEHQGGLQLSVPPFAIDLSRNCYWPNQPIELTLRGNRTKDLFKGFAIQPFVISGPKTGRRIGQFLRLDDNGSWRQQCFQKRDSVTHSHDEGKTKITLWWKNDEDDQSTVQFVATVVISLRQFWVKSVVSAPIGPCSRPAAAASEFRPMAITAPPPVGRFKIDTFHMFNQQNSAFLEKSFANELPFTPRIRPQPLAVVVPTTPIPTFTAPRPQPIIFTPNSTPQPSPRRLTHVIPLANMETNRRPSPPIVSGIATPRQFCADREPRCASWAPFCSSSMFMRTFCQRTCRLC